MKKYEIYVVIDKDGKVIDFYHIEDKEHLKDVPKNAFKISKKMYKEWTDNIHTKKYAKGKLIDIDYKITYGSWDEVRYVRNNLLSKTDWTILPDSPISEDLKESILKYRDELRNITKTYSKPEDVVFPNNPLK